MTPERRPPRAEWGTLTRDAVTTAALDILASDGLAALSIRSVATRLGVSPMALYRHVGNKDDLLDEVVDRLFADRWRPTVPERSWQRWIVDAADRLRQFLVDEPAALHVYLRHPVVSPTAATRMDACLAVLHRGLSDDTLARRAYAAVQTYTIGFAALEAARHSGRAAEISAVRDEPERAGELASFASPAQFRAGLDYLLRGAAGAGYGRVRTDRPDERAQYGKHGGREPSAGKWNQMHTAEIAGPTAGETPPAE